MVTILETMVQPLLPLLKEEGNRLKDDAQIYNLPFAHFSKLLDIFQVDMVNSISSSTLILQNDRS